ncbi:MAG: dipeptidase [Bacillota bacterium]
MDLGSLGLGKKKEETLEDASLRQERAEEIHRETIVVDGHQGTLFDVLYERKDLGEEGSGHVDLPRLRKAGVRLSILSAFLADRRYPRRGVRTGLEYVDAFRSLCDLPGAMLCTNSDHIEEAGRQDKVGFMLGFEGGEFLESSIEALRMFARQGLRLLTLTWSERNELADGAAESGTRGGLTTFGKRVVKECGRLGVIVDVSHISEAGFWDVVDMTEEPIVASHSNCHAIYGHPRNLTDDQLKSIADTGGVAAITFNPEYLAVDGGDITVGTVCDHVLHALEVAGEEHVALGSDFDAFTGDVPFTGVDELPFLTAELLKRGVSGKTLAGVLGGNWMRVIRAICR